MAYNTVSYGSTDTESVKKLQELLNQNGATLDVDGKFGPQTQQAVKKYQQDNSLAVDGIVGANTWGALTKAQNAATESTPTTTTPEETKTPTFEYGEYQKSDVVSQAEALLQQQLAQKPGEYTSAWQTQLNDTLNKILNREKFSYDLNGDLLYNQYKDQYTTQGKMAMMDTMGQAAAMTGGYGNSYAQMAGQQAYQGYLQQLNDRIPELYQLALDQYNREGDEMYNQASLMASMEEQDYGRYRDQLSDYNAELDRLTEDARYQGEMDYNKWADDRNFTYGQYSDDRAYAYQSERDKIADQQWQAQFDEAKRQFDLQFNKSSSSSSNSSNGYKGTGGGYDNGSVKEESIKAMQNALGIDDDGKWGPQSQAKAKEKWGVTSADDAYKYYQNIAIEDTPKPTANTQSFQNSIHPESEHDAVMRAMYGSYRQYVAEQIEKSSLTNSEKAYLISYYGITESDTNYKPR